MSDGNTPIVEKGDGTPDLRIKENREEFLKDPTAKKDGTPDQRLVDNRPDLQAHREQTQASQANVAEEARSG